MRTFRLTAVAAVAALMLSMPAFAAQAKSAAKPAAAKAAKTLTLSGTLQKVEGQDITIQTKTGSQEVMFGNNVTIRRAGKTLTTSDLSSATGDRVTVRYKEDNGHKMAESVTLAAAKKTAAASTKPATSAKKGTKG